VFQIFHEETREPVESPVDRVLRDGGVVGLANTRARGARRGPFELSLTVALLFAIPMARSAEWSSSFGIRPKNATPSEHSGQTRLARARSWRQRSTAS